MRSKGSFASILAIGALVILVAAPSAAGQAALDQYIPKGNPAGGDKGGGSLDNPVIPSAPNGGERAHKRPLERLPDRVRAAGHPLSRPCVVPAPAGKPCPPPTRPFSAKATPPRTL